MKGYLKTVGVIILLAVVYGCVISDSYSGERRKPAATIIVLPTRTPSPTKTRDPSITPTITPKPILVTFVCKECVMDGDNIPITLWSMPSNMGSSQNRVYHGDTCRLLDKATVEGIKKVKLSCPGGMGWTREEAIVYK